MVADRPLECSHCGETEFTHRRAQLNTALATFFGLDAHNQSADVYACRRCGRLEWFVPPDLRYLADNAPSVPDAPAVECRAVQHDRPGQAQSLRDVWVVASLDRPVTRPTTA